MFTKFYTVKETGNLINSYLACPQTFIGTYYVPGTVLTMENIMVNKADVVSALQDKSSSFRLSPRS